MNHLQDELNIFLQVVAKNHQTTITVDIGLSNLTNTFWQKMRQYTEPPSFLSILGSGADTNIVFSNQEQNGEISLTVDFLRDTIHTSEPLLNISFADNTLPRHLCGQILQILSSHQSIINLDLSGNILGIYGHHLVNTIKTWGSESCLTQLDLSHCSLPVEVCGRLLLVLGKCRKLRELWLPGNTLTGCLQYFLADHDSRLLFLQELFLSYTKLNVKDLLHLGQLIKVEKMPQLRELDLGANGLHRIEESLDDLVQTLVDRHQRELKSNLHFNRLSPESVQTIKSLCQNTDIVLEFG